MQAVPPNQAPLLPPGCSCQVPRQGEAALRGAPAGGCCGRGAVVPPKQRQLCVPALCSPLPPPPPPSAGAERAPRVPEITWVLACASCSLQGCWGEPACVLPRLVPAVLNPSWGSLFAFPSYCYCTLRSSCPLCLWAAGETPDNCELGA